MTPALIVGGVWIACGVAHYGMWVHYFQTQFESIADVYFWQDRKIAAVTALAGPLALVVSLIQFRPYGWRL